MYLNDTQDTKHNFPKILCALSRKITQSQGAFVLFALEKTIEQANTSLDAKEHTYLRLL